MTIDEPCAAPRSSCGSASGWRKGGRCPRCRAAHNEETNRYRGLRPAERTEVLRLLRAGKTAQEAAEAIGKTAASLSAAAARDGELRTALDGLPVERQVVARLGDYLAALTRTGGNRTAAARQVGIPSSSIVSASENPHFAAAEKGVLDWITEAGARPRSRVTDAMLDKAATLMEQGSTIYAAAKAVGTTTSTLRHCTSRNERLAVAFEARRGKRGNPSGLTPETAERLRKLWEDETLTVAQIAQELGVSIGTVYGWAKKLEL
jgi:transposase